MVSCSKKNVVAILSVWIPYFLFVLWFSLCLSPDVTFHFELVIYSNIHNCPPRWCDSINGPCLMVTIHTIQKHKLSNPSSGLSPEVIARCSMVLFFNLFRNDDIIIYAITFSMFISAHDGQCWQWLCSFFFFHLTKKWWKTALNYLLDAVKNQQDGEWMKVNAKIVYLKQLISNEHWKKRREKKRITMIASSSESSNWNWLIHNTHVIYEMLLAYSFYFLLFQASEDAHSLLSTALNTWNGWTILTCNGWKELTKRQAKLLDRKHF